MITTMMDAGTKLVLPGVYGHIDDGHNITPMERFDVTLEIESIRPMVSALVELLDKAVKRLIAMGCNRIPTFDGLGMTIKEDCVLVNWFEEFEELKPGQQGESGNAG